MPHHRQLIEQLKRLKLAELPGEIAHRAFVPLKVNVTNLRADTSLEFRESAVAVVLFKEKDEIHCILTQRHEYTGKHSGQVSFPGGKKDATDPDLEFTARRECFEEIGIEMHAGELVNELTELFIPVSGFMVKPYIYFHETLPELKRNEREVAEIFSFPLIDLLNDSLISMMEIQLSTTQLLNDVPYFNLKNKKVWGATAIILAELKMILRQLNA
jgi:8-oxo-dGTP pyrophosphatase MutT (NUDIX family)